VHARAEERSAELPVPPYGDEQDFGKSRALGAMNRKAHWALDLGALRALRPLDLGTLRALEALDLGTLSLGPMGLRHQKVRDALDVLLDAHDVHRVAAHARAHELRLPLRDEALRDDDERRVGAPSLGLRRRGVAEAHERVDHDVGAYRRRDQRRQACVARD
jgi:hypothetical protein